MSWRCIADQRFSSASRVAEAEGRRFQALHPLIAEPRKVTHAVAAQVTRFPGRARAAMGAHKNRSEERLDLPWSRILPAVGDDSTTHGDSLRDLGWEDRTSSAAGDAAVVRVLELVSDTWPVLRAEVFARRPSCEKRGKIWWHAVDGGGVDGELASTSGHSVGAGGGVGSRPDDTEKGPSGVRRARAK